MNRFCLAFISDKSFATQFQVDQSLIGRKIGQGVEHRVYEFGSDRVLKIPGRLKPKPLQSAVEKQQELNLMKKHFAKWTLDTEIIASKTNPYYLILQKKLMGSPILSKDNIDSVRAQFDELIDWNRRVIQEKGLCLDFIGLGGVVNGLRGKPQASNIVIENVDGEGKRLICPDIRVLKFGKGQFQSLWEMGGFRLNQVLMKRFFGVDIAGFSIK